jgi:hypothetical protein
MTISSRQVGGVLVSDLVEIGRALPEAAPYGPWANVRLVRIFPQPTTLTDNPGKEMAAEMTEADKSRQVNQKFVRWP